MTKASGVSESRESRSLGSLGVLGVSGVSGVSESQTVNCTIALRGFFSHFGHFLGKFFFSSQNPLTPHGLANDSLI